ncbi:MAG: hypothetical protein HFJ10_12725 [Lachnospiraceae bacterium]|nr:hypothetical protein [Lachnospiraceae bacterium]
MAISAVSSYSSYSSYNPLKNDYQSWVDSATAQTEELESRLNIKSSESTSSSSTSSTKKTSASSTSTFLVNYKQKLTELENASEKLQAGSRDNVFSKYEKALAALDNAKTDDEKKTAQAAVDKAKESVISAVKDFADKYNSAVSFLESNSNRSRAVATQLSSLKRSLKTEDALKTVGLGIDKSGKLTVDEDKLAEELEANSGFVKNVIGGQFGVAQNAGTKATAILDNTPVDSIVGNSASGTGSDGNGSVSDYYSSFTNFANFARGGAYNLSNYYAVGLLMNTLA